MEIKRGKMGIMCDTDIRNGPYHVRKGAAAVRKMAPLRDGICFERGLGLEFFLNFVLSFGLRFLENSKKIAIIVN
jgi:hypothetical protein